MDIIWWIILAEILIFLSLLLIMVVFGVFRFDFKKAPAKSKEIIEMLKSKVLRKKIIVVIINMALFLFGITLATLCGLSVGGLGDKSLNFSYSFILYFYYIIWILVSGHSIKKYFGCAPALIVFVLFSCCILCIQSVASSVRFQRLEMTLPVFYPLIIGATAVLLLLLIEWIIRRHRKLGRLGDSSSKRN